MNKRFLQLKFAPHLEEELRAKIKLALKRRRKKNAQYPDLWAGAIQENLKKFSLFKAAEFRVLRRQFDGGKSLLLPAAVRTARRLFMWTNEMKNRSKKAKHDAE